MKQYSKKLFSLVVLCSTATVMLHAQDRVTPFIQYRSEGRDTARKLIGETTFAIYQDDMDGCYGSFAATVQYDQTFRGKELARALFGNSLVNAPAATTGTTTPTTNSCNSGCGDETIVISGLLNATGALNTTRAATEWMAENFYLPRDFRSTLTFSPKVSNVLVDFNFYMGFDRWVNGLYFRLYGPVVHNKSGLHVSENVITPGTELGGSYEQGFFNPEAVVSNSALFQSALSFFGGCTAPAITGLVLQPLKFAKMTNCNLPTPATTTTNNCNRDCDDICGSSHTKTGFAELRGEFGWNYIQDRYRFLINLQAAAPTGSRPNAEYALEAQVGNGKHWEFGIGLGGAWKMWENEDRDKSFSFIVEADITHLFNAKQTRTFDLIGKPNSRYMLAQRLAPIPAVNTTDVPQLSGVSNAGFAFANEYAPVANLTTRDVKVSIGAQGDVVAMFNYSVRGFSWDLGYNFWGMSKSQIKCSSTDNCPDECGLVPFAERTWALKGDASVAGGAFNDTGDPVRLAATESNATIFRGTFTGTTAEALSQNPNIDAVVTPATFARSTTDPETGPVVSYATANQINTSVPPVFISASNFDFEGAETRGLSHKIFTHFSYTWTRSERWLPYLGAGFSAQFGSHSGSSDSCSTTTATTTNSCNDSNSVSIALSNWAVFVKGGISFH